MGRYRGRTFMFVAAERANVVAVYDVTSGDPRFVQLLPTGIGPEGLKFTADGLLAVTAEVDGVDEGFAARPFVTLFEPGAAGYPQLVSDDDADGLPIPWVAMSGLAGDPDAPDTLWAVSDSVLAQAYLYRVDVSSTPAVIRERIAVGGVEVDDLEGDFDLEGVAVRPEGWLLARERRTRRPGQPPPEPRPAGRRGRHGARLGVTSGRARGRGDQQRHRGRHGHRNRGGRRRGRLDRDPAGVG